MSTTLHTAVPGATTIKIPEKYENRCQGRRSRSNVPTFIGNIIPSNYIKIRPVVLRYRQFSLKVTGRQSSGQQTKWATADGQQAKWATFRLLHNWATHIAQLTETCRPWWSQTCRSVGCRPVVCRPLGLLSTMTVYHVTELQSLVIGTQ